jgi:hypothetical protein
MTAAVVVVHEALHRALSNSFPKLSFLFDAPMAIVGKAAPLGRPQAGPGRPQVRCRASGRAASAQLYVTRWPLAGLEAVDQALPAALADPAALHEAVIVVERRDGAGGGDAAVAAVDECWLFDFLPQNATDPGVISRLLAGDGVPGQARARQLGRGALPRRRRAAGVAVRPGAVARAKDMAAAWDGSELRLFRGDSRHFVEAVVGVLTDGGTTL